MNYYILYQSETSKGNPIVCRSNLDKLGIKEEAFKRCRNFKPIDQEIIYRPSEKVFDGIPEDFVRNSDFLPIISQRVIDVLKANGIDDIQYIPVQVVDLKGKHYEGYKLANILTALSDTIDKEKSDMEIRSEDYSYGKPGKIAFIWNYVIDGKKAAGHDIFRLKFDDDFEDEYSGDIFVSERFRKIIKENNFTGVTFSKITTVNEKKEPKGKTNPKKTPVKSKNTECTDIKDLPDKFNGWLDDILSQIKIDYEAVYFNLSELVGEGNYGIELCLYSEYDPYDADWFDNDLVFSSKLENVDFYFVLKGDFIACLQKIEELIKNYLARSSALAKCKNILYGFKDGDPYYIECDNKNV